VSSYLKKILHKKVAQGVGPEFKPQYHTQKTKQAVQGTIPKYDIWEAERM
jgi:hypothetical protein